MSNLVATLRFREALPWLFLLYLATSFLHFAHNAEYLLSYPNLPHWLTRPGVYLTWCFITAVGAMGYLLQRRGHERTGLALIGLYAAVGFDGLLHYARASFFAHTPAMNLTICIEVAAAALLLASAAGVATQIRDRGDP